MCLYTSVQVTLEASQLLEIDLQEVVSYPMWMLGVELGSPGRIVNFLNCQSFLQPKMDIYYLLQLSSKSSSRNPKHKVCRIFKPEIFPFAPKEECCFHRLSKHGVERCWDERQGSRLRTRVREQWELSRLLEGPGKRLFKEFSLLSFTE